MIQPPDGMGTFQFVVVAGLRTAQLMRGCVPRVDSGHKAIVTAQLEVAAGMVPDLSTAPVSVGEAEDAPAADELIAVGATQST